ncbi:MAG: hypothetical protein EP349_00540 [Alphaproteobacteria bacterium]|nr:MAG: hypothetical protein EP349_00540 [Alphaproteobacteria bacterium]
MQHTHRKISKQERDVWVRRPANLIGQGLYTGGMIGFLILLAGLELELRFKLFMAVCFFASTIGMALIQGCIEDHYLRKLLSSKKDHTDLR